MISNSLATKEVKKEEVDLIYSQLADLVTEALEQDDILLEDAQDSADFISNRLDSVSTRQELLFFLQELSRRWDIYQKVFHEFKKEDLLGKVKEELEQLKTN